jgi:hypothetical protein
LSLPLYLDDCADGGPLRRVLTAEGHNDKRRDMQPADIARAISHLLASGLPIAGEVHVLNHWR